MGDRGPVPKRSSQRRRVNEPDIPVVSVPGASTVTVPDADTTWHGVALAWYESLAKSGQSRFYEPSDWATAYLVAESMSRDLNPQFVAVTEQGDSIHEMIPLKGASLSAYLRAMNVLLVTEGDRRRASVELQRGQQSDPDEDAAVTALDEYRARISG